MKAPTLKKLSLLAMSLIFAVSCGGSGSTSNGSDSSSGSGSFNAEKSAYGDPTETSVAAIDLSMLGEAKKLHILSKSGESEFDGQTLDVIDVKIEGNSEAKMLFSPFPVTKNTKKIVFGGYHSNSGEGITPEKAVEIDLPELGETTSGNGNFTVKLPGMPIEVEVPLDWTLTLEEENVSIETPNGSYSGLRHYTGSGKITEEPLGEFLGGTEFTGDVYFSPTLGIPVKYKLNGVNFEGDLESVWDFGDPDETGPKIIKKSDTLDSSKLSFGLSTYEVKGEFDADHQTHAKMLLEIRYLDEDAAKNDPMPELNVEFGTVFGYFPSQIVESPVSIFFPEENGEGYKYFIAYVDQAAKNRDEPVSYRISVSHDGTVKPVRVTARIYYNKKF